MAESSALPAVPGLVKEAAPRELLICCEGCTNSWKHLATLNKLLCRAQLFTTHLCGGADISYVSLLPLNDPVSLRTVGIASASPHTTVSCAKLAFCSHFCSLPAPYIWLPRGGRLK